MMVVSVLPEQCWLTVRSDDLDVEEVKFLSFEVPGEPGFEKVNNIFCLVVKTEKISVFNMLSQQTISADVFT